MRGRSARMRARSARPSSPVVLREKFMSCRTRVISRRRDSARRLVGRRRRGGRQARLLQEQGERRRDRRVVVDDEDHAEPPSPTLSAPLRAGDCSISHHSSRSASAGDRRRDVRAGSQGARDVSANMTATDPRGSTRSTHVPIAGNAPRSGSCSQEGERGADAERRQRRGPPRRSARMIWPAVDPFARLSPISRVLRVTFCQRTPVRPRATMRTRKAATRPRATRGARRSWRFAARSSARDLHDEGPVADDVLHRARQRLLERGRRAGPDLDEQLGAALVSVAGKRSGGTRSSGAGRTRRAGGSPDHADDAAWPGLLAVGVSFVLVHQLAERDPPLRRPRGARSSLTTTGLDGAPSSWREPAPGRTTSRPTTALKSSVTSISMISRSCRSCRGRAPRSVVVRGRRDRAPPTRSGEGPGLPAGAGARRGRFGRRRVRTARPDRSMLRHTSATRSRGAGGSCRRSRVRRR